MERFDHALDLGYLPALLRRSRNSGTSVRSSRLSCNPGRYGAPFDQLTVVHEVVNRQQLGTANLVDDRVAPRDARRFVIAPLEARIDHNALGYALRGVAARARSGSYQR